MPKTAKKRPSYLDRLEFDPALLNTFAASYLSNIRIVAMLILAIILIGFVSLGSLQRRINPEVELPIVSIVTALPGADPEDVEQLLTIPIEDALNNADDLVSLNSTSNESLSVITAEFQSSVAVKDAQDEVQRLVDGIADLPDNATDPSVAALDFENIPIWKFVLISDTESRASLDTISKALQESIEDLPSVDRVELSGFEEEEIQVVMQPEVLAKTTLNLQTLSGKIAAASSSLPTGTVYDGQYGLPLTIEKELLGIADIRDLKITSGTEVINLGDITTVARRSAFSQSRLYVQKPGQDTQSVGVVFTIFKTKAADSTQAQQATQEFVDDFLAQQSAPIELLEIESRAVEISKQFSELFSNFALSMVLVFIVLLLFIGLRQAAIVALTIPLAFLISFSVMFATGQSLNFLTMFSLLIGLGLLVDDAIVIIASATEYYRSGKFSPLETGLLVWKDFLIPIWTTTLTTVWAFLPLLLSTGIIGEFIKPIPIIVSATLIASTSVAVGITLPLMIVFFELRLPKRVRWLLAILAVLLFFTGLVRLTAGLTFAPIIWIGVLLILLLLSWRGAQLWEFLATHKKVRSYSKLSGPIRSKVMTGFVSLDSVRRRYENLIVRVVEKVRARRLIVLGVTIWTVCSYLLVPLGVVKNEFFPPGESDTIYVNVELPVGTRIEQTQVAVREVMATLSTLPEVSLATAQSGIPPISQDQLPGSGGSHTGVVTLVLVPQEDRQLSVFTIEEQALERVSSLSQYKISTFIESGGPPAGSDVTVKILGDDLSTLNELAETISTELEQSYEVSGVTRSVKAGTSKLNFSPKVSQLESESLSAQAVGTWLRALVSGYELAQVRFVGEQELLPVRFYVGSGPVAVEQLGSLAIPTQSGPRIATDLGTLTLESTPTVIARENGRRAITVTASSKPEANAGDINAGILAFAAQLPASQGYSFETGGANQENQESVASILRAMVLALILIVFTMIVQFNSFRQALLVSLVIPLAISGVFVVFAITRTPLSFPSLIGVLALFGIVVNNSIVIVDKINQNRSIGLPFSSAIADASGSRLEPIFFSSLTTIVGLLPITITDPIWRGLGGAIIAGLLFSGATMLLFIPAVYASWYSSEDSA